MYTHIKLRSYSSVALYMLFYFTWSLIGAAILRSHDQPNTTHFFLATTLLSDTLAHGINESWQTDYSAFLLCICN